MKKVTRKHITKENHESIKLLQAAKLSIPQATKVTGRSYSTIKKVYETDSYKEYKVKAAPRKRVAVTPILTPLKDERPQEDTQLILSKLDQISTCLNTLLDVIQDKEAKANTSFWKR